jgi:hypothetical protein
MYMCDDYLKRENHRTPLCKTSFLSTRKKNRPTVGTGADRWQVKKKLSEYIISTKNKLNTKKRQKKPTYYFFRGKFQDIIDKTGFEDMNIRHNIPMLTLIMLLT